MNQKTLGTSQDTKVWMFNGGDQNPLGMDNCVIILGATNAMKQTQPRGMVPIGKA